MKRLFLFLIPFLQACNPGTTEIEFNNEQKKIKVITENYHISNVLVTEVGNPAMRDSIYSSIDVDKPLKQIDLNELEGTGKLWGIDMEELLQKKNLEYKIVLRHDSSDMQKLPLYFIYFTTEDIDKPVEIFESI